MNIGKSASKEEDVHEIYQESSHSLSKMMASNIAESVSPEVKLRQLDR